MMRIFTGVVLCIFLIGCGPDYREDARVYCAARYKEHPFGIPGCIDNVAKKLEKKYGG